MLQKAIISIGSNSADRQAQMQQALDFIQTILEDARHTDIYPTAPCYGAHGEYLNAVVTGYTTLTSQEIEQRAKMYERERGRRPHSAIVPIDIDLVSLGSILVRPRELQRPYFVQGMTLLNEKLPQEMCLSGSTEI